MNSAGNDIVALAAIDVARTRQPEFYSRIITPAEQKLYSGQLKELFSFEHFVWLAWSVKESAYKFLKRFDTQLVFSPTSITINPLTFSDENFAGTVSSGEHVIYFRSFVNQEYTFSIVNDQDDFSDVRFGIKKIYSSRPDDQSESVRDLLISTLTNIFPESDLQIAKSPHGWPFVVNRGEELPIPVSFTHHGHFVAYSFNLNQTPWKAHQLHAEIL